MSNWNTLRWRYLSSLLPPDLPFFLLVRPRGRDRGPLRFPARLACAITHRCVFSFHDACASMCCAMRGGTKLSTMSCFSDNSTRRSRVESIMSSRSAWNSSCAQPTQQYRVHSIRVRTGAQNRAHNQDHGPITARTVKSSISLRADFSLAHTFFSFRRVASTSSCSELYFSSIMRLASSISRCRCASARFCSSSSCLRAACFRHNSAFSLEASSNTAPPWMSFACMLRIFSSSCAFAAASASRWLACRGV